MTATIVPFPRPPRIVERPTLGDLLKRRSDPALCYFEREQMTTCIETYRAAGHLLALPDDVKAREKAIAAGVESLEHALFHALSMQGCPNHSRDLYQILACRQQQRSNR